MAAPSYDKKLVACTPERNDRPALFPDVNEHDWFWPYICSAKAQSIIDGYPDGTFRPAHWINFAEVSKIISVALNLDPEIGADPWYRGYVEAIEGHGAIPVSITGFSKNITRGEMAEVIYRLKTEQQLKRGSLTYEILECAEQPSLCAATAGNIEGKKTESDCPLGFLIDTHDSSFVTETHVCKPITMQLTADRGRASYLGKLLVGVETEWRDWSAFEPLTKKVEELISGVVDDEEKVKRIANWVRSSKSYSCRTFPPPVVLESCLETPANNGADFSQIYYSDKGICFDAALITTAMFRLAGIPAEMKVVDINHIVTLYQIEDHWYSIDTTFCPNSDQCLDAQLMKKTDAEENLQFVYRRHGHFKSKTGLYCDQDICMKHPFQRNVIMPPPPSIPTGTIIWPSLRQAYISNGQLHCYLEAKNMNCGGGGCTFSESANRWRHLDLQYAIEDMRNIGYNKAELPTHMRLLHNSEGAPVDIVYRYACRQTYPRDRYVAVSKEFVLEQNESAYIDYHNLLKASEGTKNELHDIKHAIKAVTEDLQIRP